MTKVRNLKRGRAPESGKKDPVSEEDNDKYNDKYKYKNNDDTISFSPALSAEKKETHPALDEIVEYAREIDLPVDAQLFFDYYEANGWHIGKLPMKDWRAAVRSWETNGMDVRGGPAPRQASAPDEFRAAMEMVGRKEAREV